MIRPLFIVAMLLLSGCNARTADTAERAQEPNPYLDDENPYLTDEESEATSEHAADEHQHYEDGGHKQSHEPDSAPPPATTNPPVQRPATDPSIWDDDPSPIPDDDQDDWKPVPEPDPEPERVKPKSWAEVPARERYRVNQNTLIILGSCGLENQNKNGTWNTYCVPCNSSATAAWRLRSIVSVGDKPDDQIQIINFETEAGRLVNWDLGPEGKSLTKAKGGTPLLIFLRPDSRPTVIAGWTRDPRAESTAWWILSKLGIDRNNPQSWMKASGDPHRDLTEAIVQHISYGDDVFTVGAVATIPLRSIIEYFSGAEGRREIFDGLYMVCPPNVSIEFDKKTPTPRIIFPRGGPGFEFQKYFLTIRRNVQYIDLNWELTECRIMVSGKRTPLIIRIDQ